MTVWNIGLGLAAAVLLSACLSTSEPVLDQTNSLPVGEIPQFIEVVEAWESFVGTDGSPRELIADGARGVMVDDILVVQENSDYYAMAVIGGRPVACFVHADETIEEVAKAHGVTVEIDRSDTEYMGTLGPKAVEADGPPEALLAFVRDQFANQALACTMPKRGGG